MREGRDVRGKYGGEVLVEEELGRELEVKGKSSNWRREKLYEGSYEGVKDGEILDAH